MSYTLVFDGMMYSTKVTADVDDYESGYVITTYLANVDLILDEYEEIDEGPITFKTSGEGYFNTITVDRISASVDG